MTKKKVMTIEEYCLKEGKQTLLQNFMLDINPDPSKNMCCADSAIYSRYSDTTFLFNFKCHICNTEWEGSGYSYIVKGLTCPTCNEDSTHQKIKYASVKKGSIILADWCNDNEEQGQRIIDEYDDENNELTREKAFRLSYAAHTELNWKCREHGHRWSAVLHARTLQLQGCPYCSSNKVSELNSLYNYCLNNERGKQIQAEWSGIDEDGNTVNINEVSKTSGKRMIWCCEHGHKWCATIAHRIFHNSNCPYCAGKKVTEQNSLESWALKEGEFGEKVLNEYTGITEDGKHIKIEDISYGSGTRLKWKCKHCGRSWFISVNQRTAYKSSCPHCCANQTSYPEQFIYWSMKQIYTNTENRCIILKSKDNIHGVEFDIGIAELRLYIEYSPTYWHNSRKERDDYKKQLCEKNNIRLIQIIEDNYNEYEKMFTENYICIPTLTRKNKDEYLVKIVDYILKSVGHSIDEIDINLVKKNAFIYSTGKIDYEKSLEFNYPELVKEWNNALNNVKPSEIISTSHIRANWICPYCNYMWEAHVHSRVNQKSGCPRCRYNWHKAETNQPQNIKSQYRKSATPSKPKTFKYVELSDIDKEMQSWDF